MVGVFTYKDGEGVGFIGGGVFIIRTSLFTLLLARLLDRSHALNYYLNYFTLFSPKEKGCEIALPFCFLLLLSLPPTFREPIFGKMIDFLL